MARNDNPLSSAPTQNARALPEVGRPRGAAWKALQDEGIEVESQVQVVGDGQDLATRLILTKERLVLAAGGQIIVEFPRTWLRPQARLLAENGIRIFITPEGIDVEPNGDGKETERITLRARDGRGAAASLVRAMSGTGPSAASEPARASLPPVNLPSTTAPRATAPLPLEMPSWRSPEPPAHSRATMPEPPSDPSAESPLATRMTPSWATGGHQSQAGGDGRQPIATRTQSADGAGSIAAWTAQHLDTPSRSWERPAPVPSAVSRAARQHGTTADGRTVRDDQIVPLPSRPSAAHRAGVWVLRAAVILLFLGGATFLGRDYLRGQIAKYDLPIPSQIENGLGIAPLATGEPEVSQIDAQSTETPTTEAVNVVVVPSVTPTQPGGDNILDDQGGTTGPIPTASVAAVVPTEESVTEEPAAPTEDVVTEEPTDMPVTEAPTEIPVTEAPVTIEPTVVSTEPVETNTPEPTETSSPTEAVTPTAEATETATAEPTATTTATEGPAPTPTLVPQEASVDPGTPPDQQVAADGMRYSLEGASFGESVPELPEINPATGYGNWLVLRMRVENTTGANQVFDMNAIKLYADGQEILLDDGTSWVNGLLGINPAYGNTESILWAPGESHDVALTFLAPLNFQTLTLSIGGQSMDLSTTLANPGTLFTEDSASSAVPDAIEAKVVKVIDGSTIVVEIDGVQQTVRYLGIQAPTEDDCFASEATAANVALVDGKSVRIERQATNVDPRGNWVRDVWAPTSDGRYALVSASLVAEGAAQTRISEPNTRFSSWLLGSEAAAKAQGLGLWQHCGTGSDTTTTNATNGSSPEAPMPTIAPVNAIAPTSRESL